MAAKFIYLATPAECAGLIIRPTTVKALGYIVIVKAADEWKFRHPPVKPIYPIKAEIYSFSEQMVGLLK